MTASTCILLEDDYEEVVVEHLKEFVNNVDITSFRFESDSAYDSVDPNICPIIYVTNELKLDN